MTEETGIFQISDRNDLEAIENVLSSKGSFVEMADILGLDKATDFQWTNLRGVDFTNSDLRGFDFTGADLRGSHGVNLAYDHTTRIENADVQDSPFGYIAFERSVRKTNVDFDREYQRLRNSYWSDQLPYVTDRIKTASDREGIQLMAMRLFVDAKDNVVRGDMIRALSYAGMDREEYLSFLLHVCATRREPIVLVAAIDAIGAFRNRRPVFDTLLALTSHESEMVKVAAYEKLVRSKHLENARDVIAQKLAADSSPLVRQAVARGLARTVGFHGREIMANLDFAKAVGSSIVIGSDQVLQVALNVGHSNKMLVEQVRREAITLVDMLAELGIPIMVLSRNHIPLTRGLGPPHEWLSRER